MSKRLHEALLDMADPARKLADALAQYHDSEFGRIACDGTEYKALTVIDPAHAHLITGQPTDRAIMEELQQRTDELLHAIDLARATITGAIPLQTLDLVRPKVKDVLENIAGTVEKDMKP